MLPVKVQKHLLLYGKQKCAEKAFQNTRLQKGLSFVEVVGTCNSGWKMTPVDANKWMKEHMFENIRSGTSKTSKKG